MGLFKRKNSEIWQMRFQVNGKPVRRSTGTANKKLAQRILDAKKGEVAEGRFKLKRSASMGFDKLVDEFLETHSKVEKKSYERDYYIGQSFKRYFKNVKIENIKFFDIKKWREWRISQKTKQGKSISRASVNRELAFLKTMFNFAIDAEWLDENPALSLFHGAFCCIMSTLSLERSTWRRPTFPWT